MLSLHAVWAEAGRGQASLSCHPRSLIELNGPLPAPTVFSLLLIAKGPKPAPSCRLRLGSPGKSIVRQAGDPAGGGPAQTFRPSRPPHRALLVHGLPRGPGAPLPPQTGPSSPGPPPANRSLGLPGNRGSAAHSSARDAPRPGCSRPSPGALAAIRRRPAPLRISARRAPRCESSALEAIWAAPREASGASPRQAAARPPARPPARSLAHRACPGRRRPPRSSRRDAPCQRSSAEPPPPPEEKEEEEKEAAADLRIIAVQAPPVSLPPPPPPPPLRPRPPPTPPPPSCPRGGRPACPERAQGAGATPGSSQWWAAPRGKRGRIGGPDARGRPFPCPRGGGGGS